MKSRVTSASVWFLPFVILSLWPRQIEASSVSLWKDLASTGSQTYLQTEYSFVEEYQVRYDSRWAFSYSADGDGSTYGPKYVGAVGSDGSWDQTSLGGARWITPTVYISNTNQAASTSAGYYNWSVTFNIDPGLNLDLDTVNITGQWMADDAGGNIYVNNTENYSGYPHISGGWPGSGSPQTFSLTRGFTTGLNTLTFNEYSVGGPAGIEVEFDSATAETQEEIPSSPIASAVPLPDAAYLGLPMLGLLAGWRVMRQRGRRTLDL